MTDLERFAAALAAAHTAHARADRDVLDLRYSLERAEAL